MHFEFIEIFEQIYIIEHIYYIILFKIRNFYKYVITASIY